MKGKIGILDSGIGGVSVLREIIKEIPNGEYYYLSDSKNNPYGEKSKEEIQKIVFQNVEHLLKQECKLIVLACNTATAVAIDALRKQYPSVTFIGTEPAIKMAHDHPVKGTTLLLATKLTLECERIQNLISTYPVENLVTYPCVGLADRIENQRLSELDAYFQEHFTPYQDSQIVVLGCTHYPLIKEQFQKFFSHATIIDGSKGIAKETKRQAERMQLSFEVCRILLEDTSNDPEKLSIFRTLLEKQE